MIKISSVRKNLWTGGIFDGRKTARNK